MRKVLSVSGLLGLMLACGCASGPKVVPIKGKLTNGGKSVLADRKNGITIVFTPIAEPGQGATTTYPAALDTDTDTFVVQGPDGKGMPLGKYKVSLTIITTNTTPEINKINDQFSASRTPIEIDVTGPEVNIDLEKYKK
jgi:hypothetical protein